MKLREDFIQLENIDPLRYITIASVCMTIYCSNYMPKKTIAIVPEYAKTDNFSKMSIHNVVELRVKWYAHTTCPEWWRKGIDHK